MRGLFAVCQSQSALPFDLPFHTGKSGFMFIPVFKHAFSGSEGLVSSLQDHYQGRRHARRLQYLSHMPDGERNEHLQRTLTAGQLPAQLQVQSLGR